MRCRPLFLSILLIAGCKSSGSIKTVSGLSVKPPTQSESPTQASESKATQALTLPAGSTIQVLHLPATPTSPESTQTTYTLAKDSVQSLATSSQTVSLSPTRKPDTSVELHKIDVAERRWLLFIGIGLLVGGVAVKSLLPAWPGLPNSLFLSGIIALAAWKLAEIPAWIWACGIAVSALLAIGYKRGEVDEKKQS